MKKIDNTSKLKQLSISELDTVRKVLKDIYMRGHLDDSDKDIYKERINAIEEEIKIRINNLF